MKYDNISVVIPAYNESSVIGKTLNRVIDYLKKNFKLYEIIVVDDGSTDDTCDIVNNYKEWDVKLLRNKENMGKGFSVKKGMLNAKHSYVLFSDADLSTPIEELGNFMKLINEYDVVIASRSLKESNLVVKQPFHRIFAGKGFYLLVSLLAMPGFKDTQCGFKLFRKKVSKEVFRLQTFNGFSFDVEVLYIAKKKGYKIKEEPVTWMNSEKSAVSPVKDSFKMFLDIVRIKFRDLKGVYGQGDTTQ